MHVGFECRTNSHILSSLPDDDFALLLDTETEDAAAGISGLAYSIYPLPKMIRLFQPLSPS